MFLVPSLRTIRRPASLSTLRCWETAGRETGSASASSPTARGRRERRSKISRRVGSESAAKQADVLAIAYGKYILTITPKGKGGRENFLLPPYVPCAHRHPPAGQSGGRFEGHGWLHRCQRAEEVAGLYVHIRSGIGKQRPAAGRAAADETVGGDQAGVHELVERVALLEEGRAAGAEKIEDGQCVG